jgi:hypothetical protein
MRGAGVQRGPLLSIVQAARATYIFVVEGYCLVMKRNINSVTSYAQIVTAELKALLCLPITQYNESSSDEGGSDADSYVSDDDQCCCGCGKDVSDSRHYCLYSMKRVLPSCYHPDQEVNEVDGKLSYCLQCYGKVAHTRKKSDEEEEVPLSIQIASGRCCCGCGLDASASNHYCIYTGKRVMAWCYQESQEVEEEHGSKALCKRCFGQQKTEEEEDEEDESEESEEEEEPDEAEEEKKK